MVRNPAGYRPVIDPRATISESATSLASPVVEVRDITKRYGGATVLDAVSLAVRAGEVRALLGENGAGKSTLIKILSGVVRSDGGVIEVAGKAVELTRPAEASAHGIATLHQELSIVPGLSVAENIVLGHPYPTRLGRVRWRELDRRARALLELLGQDLPLRADVAALSPVGKTMTAIARALSYDARLLILDEPTAALTDAETQQLFATMQRLRSQGVAILYVSHRLEEVMAVCDTFTVLRNGQMVADGDLASVSIPDIINAMAGRDVALSTATAPRPSGEVIMRVDALRGRRVDDVHLEVRAGEVVGIAGLAGSGRSEILRILAGAQQRRGGRITVDGEVFHPRSVADAHRSGVVLVPQERRHEGLIPDSVAHNANLTTLIRHAWGRVVMRRTRARHHAHTLVDSMQVRYRSLDQDVLTLSGGNQQKVVLGKFLALNPRVLLLDEPTRGVDVGTKAEIYQLVRARAQAGMASVVVSSELSELLTWCDRIVVMYEGHMVASLDPATTSEDRLLHACYGRETT
jgi:ABC-type sugar transport system ATPase subunit